jgi:hypothetical protein
MSKRTKALSTPESKVEWQRNKKLGSRFIYIGTPANDLKFPVHEYDKQGRRIV